MGFKKDTVQVLDETRELDRRSKKNLPEACRQSVTRLVVLWPYIRAVYKAGDKRTVYVELEIIECSYR